MKRIFAILLMIGLPMAANAAGGPGCSNPAAQEGKVIYNQDYHTYQFCDGDDWMSMAAGIRYVAGGDPPTDCPNVGDICTDGSVYAGLIGADPIYTTRCDAGMTWNGSSCTGGRLSDFFNNGNTSGYVNVGAGDLSDGAANTATLVATDSDSGTAGTQDHKAAQYCADLIMHGQGDWYLPAKNELNILCGNKVAIGNFETGSATLYWTSNQSGTNYAWWQRLQDCYVGSGAAGSNKKDYVNALRCVRR